MRELFYQIEEWVEKKSPFAIATVIQTWGSSPRPVGSSMLVSSEMEMAGSVSGGCVETAVVRETLSLMDIGGGKRLAYGVADEDAWAVGLSCGGKIQVYLERFMAFDSRETERTAWETLRDCFKNNNGCILITELADGEGGHTVVLPDGAQAGVEVQDNLIQEALAAYHERRHIAVTIDGRAYFIRVFPPRLRLLVIGAAHITADLVELSKLFGFESIVIDPRGAFADKTQFTVAPDSILVNYPSEVLPALQPDPYTWAVILSHDPKIDDDALRILLPSPVAYIGALGSKRTHAKRVERLRKGGFSDDVIGRIQAPIGLDINARTPREIALAIMAEIIQEKNRYLR